MRDGRRIVGGSGINVAANRFKWSPIKWNWRRTTYSDMFYRATPVTSESRKHHVSGRREGVDIFVAGRLGDSFVTLVIQQTVIYWRSIKSSAIRNTFPRLLNATIPVRTYFLQITLVLLPIATTFEDLNNKFSSHSLALVFVVSSDLIVASLFWCGRIHLASSTHHLRVAHQSTLKLQR